MSKSKAKLHVASKFNVDQLREQPLFSTNPEAALPLLSMIGQAQLSIDDLLSQLSRQFIEHMLVLSAQSVAGVQHKGRHTGEVRWHGSQSGVVRLGQSKIQVKRPRLRTTDGEVAVPAYAALANNGVQYPPTLIDYIQDRNGKVIWRSLPPMRRTRSADVAVQFLESLAG